MRVTIHESADQLDYSSAMFHAGQLQHKPNSVLGLATGSTPIGHYRELVRLHLQGLVSFREAVTFNLDEYADLSRNHPQSYFAYMKQHLFSHVDVHPENTHIPNGEASDLHAECERYDRLLRHAGRIDLQILGLGHNGHIGFNEPERSLNVGTHVVQLREETRRANARFFPSLEQVPTRAITMGMGPILQAKKILLLVRGEDKADIVCRALSGPLTTECPASLLQTHPDLVVMLDSGAASKWRQKEESVQHERTPVLMV